MLLYHPFPATAEKYGKFYNKLLQLTESEKDVSLFTIKTTDGILLDTIYIKNPDSDKCIIYFHGNAGNISMRYDMIKFLYNYCSVVVFDYRSFGKSTGDTLNLSCHGLYNDSLAIWKHTNEKLGYKPNNISLFGESLGCSVVLHLAYELSKTFDNSKYPHSLILNSPFFSLSSMINIFLDKINMGFVSNCITLFVGSEYQSDKWIQFINHQTKIVIAHSPRDEIVPYHQGWNLYKSIEKSHQSVHFVNITGTHNNIGLTDNYIYLLADIFMDD